MEIGGLPLHPLVVHAAVVLTPAAAVMAVVYAARARWRWLTRWPTVLTTVAALATLLVAKRSGESLLSSRAYLLQSKVIAERVQTHQALGNELVAVMAVFAVLVLVAAWTLGGPSAAVSGWGERESRTVALDRVLSAVLVLGAVVVLVWVVRTGDAGARAVWSG
jgi:uncharacterized membrane protein